MSLDIEKIRSEYLQFESEFKRIALEIEGSLKLVAKKYYSETRFQVYIPALRIKTFESIAGKLERKKRNESSLFNTKGDIMRLVTNDIIGGRILCNTQEDVEEISKIISTYPRFKVEKRDSIEKSNGYTALHLDILYETFWKDNRIYIPLEIQIKTHLQHAWSETTHDDDYKPEDKIDIDDTLKAYYKHIAKIISGLDGFLITIRKQKLSFVTPPNQLGAADTVINSKTLSYTISKYRKGDQITIQEMNILLRRLKENSFETIEHVETLIKNKQIEDEIKVSKEGLLIKENVTSFELLKYGALLSNGKALQFKEEIKSDLGFVKERCNDCGNNLTKEELEFIKTKTDSDIDFYCQEHRTNRFPNECPKCGLLTSKDLCINCAADLALSSI